MTLNKLAPLLLSLILLAPALPARAADPETGTRTELLAETSVPLSRAEAAAFFGGPAKDDDRILVIPAILIVMAGAKVWNVIMDNRPTANLDSAYASAIPGFAFNWNDLAAWRKVTRRYRFTIDKKLQGRAVDIVYEVSFYHGAIPSPENPALKGRYIANFTVKPLDINLKWGWKVSLQAAMSNPMNIGTAEEPVAWLNADLTWRYAKPLSTDPEIGVNSLAVDGYGKLAEAAYGQLDISPVPVAEYREDAPALGWN